MLCPSRNYFLVCSVSGVPPVLQHYIVNHFYLAVRSFPTVISAIMRRWCGRAQAGGLWGGRCRGDATDRPRLQASLWLDNGTGDLIGSAGLLCCLFWYGDLFASKDQATSQTATPYLTNTLHNDGGRGARTEGWFPVAAPLKAHHNK